MSNDRIVIREPRLDLGTNREVPTSFTGEQAYDWLAIHHPQTNAAAVRDGNAAAVDRPAAFIDDELEAVRTRGDRNGIPLVMKDLILETPSGNNAVMVPSPVAGYAEFRNDDTNAISLWSKPIGSPDNELVGQVLHGERNSSPFQPGDFVPYGAPLVRQSDVGSPGAVHAHIEVEPAQFKQYLGDILSERINTQQRPGDNGQPVPAAPPPADPMADGVLRHGERGEAVRALQEALNAAGIRDANGQPLPTTGYYGDMTKAAVEKYQTQHGLEPDGKAGNNTLTALGLKQDPQQPAPTNPQQPPTDAQPTPANPQQPPTNAQPTPANPQQPPPTDAQPTPTNPQQPPTDAQPTPVNPQQPPANPQQPPVLEQPSQTDRPLVSNPNHPDNRLYQQAVANLEQLGPSGGFKSREDLEKAAAAVAVDAKATGLQSIDHVSKTSAPNGQTYLVAVQGDPTSPAAKNSFIDYGQAVNQTVAQSTAMADVHKPAVAAAQADPAQQQEPNKVAVGAR
jgi:peptidoglycan hydrolase-like protein with peptidoglycan-binding domain